MSHFARVNAQGIVEQVIVAEQEFIDTLSDKTSWVQTSYNGNFRKNYAGIGYSYDSVRDVFIPPKPYASWVLNENTCLWGAPTPCPTDEKTYNWDENTQQWVETGV